MNPEQNQDFNQPQPTQPPSVTPPAQTPTQPPYTDPNILSQTPMPQPGKSRTKLLLIVAILILLAGGAAAYFVTKNNNDKNKEIGGSASLNGSNASTTICIPIIASSLDKASMITTYERFAKAVAAKNQSCADSLSTSFFLTNAKQKFGAADGKWITAQVAGLPPISDDFSKLPSTLTEASFKQAAYTRAIVAGSSDQTAATGTSLSYPENDASTKSQISISFVLDSGNIKVDDVVVEPQT